MEEKYIKIQLPEELSPWSGRKVILSHGQHNTVMVMTEEYFSEVQEGLKKLLPAIPSINEFMSASTGNSEITNRGALFIPDYFEQHFSKNDDDIEAYEISDRFIILTRDPDVLNEDFIKTLKEKESKYSKKITILGEEFTRRGIPHVAKMIDFNREDWEARIMSIAKAWHQGEISPAVISLELDLAHG